MQNSPARAPCMRQRKRSWGSELKEAGSKVKDRGTEANAGAKQNQRLHIETPLNPVVISPGSRKKMLENSHSVNTINDVLKILNVHFARHGGW